MITFKDEVLRAVMNNVPASDESIIFGDSEKIKFIESKEIGIGKNVRKCCLVIQWEEIIQHPCRGCPGYDYACSNPPVEPGEKGEE